MRAVGFTPGTCATLSEGGTPHLGSEDLQERGTVGVLRTCEVLQWRGGLCVSEQGDGRQTFIAVVAEYVHPLHTRC